MLEKYNNIYERIKSKKSINRKCFIGSDSIWGDIHKVHRELQRLKNSKIDLLGLCIGFVVMCENIDFNKCYCEMFDVFAKEYPLDHSFSIERIASLEKEALQIDGYYVYRVGCAIKLKQF